MSRAAVIVGLTALLAACTGQGVDRSDAIPVRASLAVRAVADGDPWVDTIAATAQGTLAAASGIEVTVERMWSRSLPPVHSQRIRGTKGPLVELVKQAGPAPAGLVAAYEHERDDRWSLVVVRVDGGMELGPGTLVKPSWGTEPADPREPDFVFLLLDPDDAKEFEQLTIDHDGRRLAIVDGDEVLMAPTVQEPIGGGQLRITPGPDGTAADLYERLSGQPAPPRP